MQVCSGDGSRVNSVNTIIRPAEVDICAATRQLRTRRGEKYVSCAAGRMISDGKSGRWYLRNKQNRIIWVFLKRNINVRK